MIKRAMSEFIQPADSATASRLLLQVRDELVLEVKPEEMPEVRKLVREAMLEALPIDCPLDISLGQGDNWLAAH